eukprot:4105515-Amphidinium_carterae.1
MTRRHHPLYGSVAHFWDASLKETMRTTAAASKLEAHPHEKSLALPRHKLDLKCHVTRCHRQSNTDGLWTNWGAHRPRFQLVACQEKRHKLMRMVVL